MMRYLFKTITLLFLLCGHVLANEDPNLLDPKILPPEWDEETVNLFERLLIQDERLKPVGTMAGVKLLQYRGIKGLRLKMTDGSKRDLSPTAWLLDALFYPDAAAKYPIFLVEDRDALELIGLQLDKKKRERYSFNELEPARDKLLETAERYAKIEAKERTPVQNMIVSLANNFTDFEYVLRGLDFARTGIPIYAGEEASGDVEKMPASTFVRDELEGLVQEIRLHGDPSRMPPALAEVANEFLTIAQAARASVRGVYLFPPKETDDSVWLTCGDLLYGVMTKVPGSAAGNEEFETYREWVAKRVESVERLVAARDDREKFKQELQAFSDARADDMQARIEASAASDAEDWQRSEARQVKVSGAEVTYHRAKFFKWAWVSLSLIFVMVAMTWISPQAAWARVVRTTAFWSTLVPIALIAVGMSYRIYIMGRAPVSELYETIPFITFVVLVVGMLMDSVLKQPFMLPLVCALGILGLLMANRYEVVDGSDTMNELTAVLRSNFWLTWHVLVVLIGYAAGILASVMSAVYIIGRLFDIRRTNKDFFRVLTRATYGVLCFGLLFSLVGTILGGIWANDSWGRFWGWDPKENGALMIVLWFLMILHARAGGIIKEFGVHLLSVIGGGVVVFSWFHTNQLGVGLHSYGFTSGVLFAIYTAYAVIGLVFLVGLISSVVSKILVAASKSEKATAGS